MVASPDIDSHRFVLEDWDGEQAYVLLPSPTIDLAGLDAQEVEEEFWRAVSAAGFEAGPLNQWIWEAGLPQALELRRLRLLVARRWLVEVAAIVVRHLAGKLLLVAKVALEQRSQRSELLLPDAVTTCVRHVAAVLSPRLSRPNPALA